MKTNYNKTTPGVTTVTAYLQSLSAKDRAQAKTLVDVFKKASGKKPVLWGTSIIGFDSYHYRYDSGREGDFLATGFSMRKSGPTIYIMPGYQYPSYQALLTKLGPHKLGKSCLYLKSLEGIDLNVLETLIKTGLKDLAKKYPVN